LVLDLVVAVDVQLADDASRRSASTTATRPPA
jgi:hypothetical protein